ncbi:Adenosine deaminase 2 [Eumeta japonica]|uniref:Adenosine deaminase n=1 Tax=Eumeta variegata TaxID=151549 RepID=A0A4C1VAL5_EUMVA|nr:Adenosine deaminase 2 [Eumeta japonica]
MSTAVVVILLSTCLHALAETSDPKDQIGHYKRLRNELFQKELEMMLGSDIVLTDNEQKANDIIMELKNAVVDDGFTNPRHFNFSKHFFEYKDQLTDTMLYRILRDMPKGALLHAHDTGILAAEYVLNITYWDDLYVCRVEDEIEYLFSSNTPIKYCKTKWVPMKEVRYTSGNVKKFDSDLIRRFSIVVDDPAAEYPDINTVWSKFSNYFISTTPLLTYKPAWEFYFYETLKAAREEGIMYVEIRSVLPSLYDLNGEIYSSVDTAKSYKDVLDKFMKNFPDFYGAKLIYAPHRRVSDETVEQYVQIAQQIKRKMPDFLAGFDFVGQEDLGRPLAEIAPQVLELAAEMNFIFHAGETNWYGKSSDENIIDAIALGTKRIGHGYAITKHPALMEEVKNRDIALEVNVVSNAVLGLVADVRNHPLATMMARGLPVVLSSDDPGVWGADILTHDYYVAFVAVASRHADLRLLKKLAKNSLYYSTISDKDKALHEFEIRWTKFIGRLLKDKWSYF